MTVLYSGVKRLLRMFYNGGAMIRIKKAYGNYFVVDGDECLCECMEECNAKEIKSALESQTTNNGIKRGPKRAHAKRTSHDDSISRAWLWKKMEPETYKDALESIIVEGNVFKGGVGKRPTTPPPPPPMGQNGTGRRL